MLKLRFSKIKYILAALSALVLVWISICYFLVVVKGDSIYNPQASKNLSYKIPVGSEYVKNKYNERVEILTAKSQKPESSEIFLYFHGNAGRLPRLVEEMSQFGTVISPAYPGFSSSEGRPTTDRILETADLAISWLKDKGLDPSKITVIGHSMGGNAALYTASKYPNIKKLVLVSVFYSIQAMCETQYSILCALTGDILNSSRLAPKVLAKVRQFHNPKDQLVPYSQGKDLFEIIGSKDKKFTEFNGSGPDFHNSFSVAEILVE